MKLLKFYADWCGPCKMLKPVAEKIADENGLELVDVDIDNQHDLVHQYGVQGVPTLVLLDEEDHEIARSVGMQTKANITAALSLG